MGKNTPTKKLITEQVDDYDIEFGERYRDKASRFEGNVVGIHFYEHGCMRVALRGASLTTGEPIEANFDAPELIRVATDTAVPAGTRRGGPHGLSGPPRR